VLDTGIVGSRRSSNSNPQRRSIQNQLSSVRKYQGAGSLKSELKPCQVPFAPSVLIGKIAAGGERMQRLYEQTTSAAQVAGQRGEHGFDGITSSREKLQTAASQGRQ